jgi:tetratricopeptide (TPR) repeat protein
MTWRTSPRSSGSWWGVHTEHLREELRELWTRGFDEIVGGTDRLPAAFAARLRAKPRMGAEVVAIEQDPLRRRAAAIYLERGRPRRVEGNFVLCTLPFSVLSRLGIDRTFSGPKQRAIRELNYDSSTKVLALAARRFWETDDGIFGGGIYRAAKDLELAIRLDPNNFYARHNYAQAAFQAGDVGTDQPNMRLAVIQFTKAIQLNPKSARSYMGRGWAYQMLNDSARMQADYDMALRLDASLRAVLLEESNGIAQKRAQLAGVPAMLDRMARYRVETSVRNQNECAQYRGYWTNGECRISMALDPTP